MGRNQRPRLNEPSGAASFLVAARPATMTRKYIVKSDSDPTLVMIDSALATSTNRQAMTVQTVSEVTGLLLPLSRTMAREPGRTPSRDSENTSRLMAARLMGPPA